MNAINELLSSKNEEILLIIALAVCVVLFLIEFYKFRKYKTKSDVMDFSMLGLVFFLTYLPWRDLFLSSISVIFILMIIGTYELRESPVWLRLMSAFTLTYGYLLFGTIFEKVLRFLVADQIITIPHFLAPILDPNRIAGFFWSTMMWVLLIASFAFFGKRFILVSRFLSPQYVYLFVYSAVYFIIFALDVPWQLRYLAIFISNAFLYMISGPMLTFLFQIKPLEDERARRIIKEIETKIGTPIRSIGIVQAPILNAFAYGPWFDQRFAFIVKDINNFTDEELLGITAHEVSHLKGKHTFWLLWVGFVDLFIRLMVGIPATQLDYVFSPSNKRPPIDLFTYYMINIVFFAISLIFVRIMEANADKRAKEIGYGKELAEALYTLEGFYRGIAGELGLNAQLLTDSSRTQSEEIRFTAEAGIEMHNRLMEPSRYALIMNLIVSHPPTPFRIAAMVSDDISSVRLALLPILLIIPGIRSRNIKLLRTTEQDVAQLLTIDYKKKYSSLENYGSNSFADESLKYYVNRNIILISKLDNKTHYVGTLKAIKYSDYIVDPYSLVLDTQEGEITIPSKLYSIRIFEPGTQYIVKKKQIMTLKSYEMSKKGKFTYFYEKDANIVKLHYLGMTLKDFSVENSFIRQSRGKYEPLALTTIDEIKTPITRIEKTNGFAKASLNFVSFNPGTEILLKANDLKINVSPVVLFFYKRFENENISLIKFLIKMKTRLTLYTSKDPDIGIPCEFTNVTDDKKIYYRCPGETNEESLGIRQVDALVLRNPYKLIQSKNEIGFFSKLASKIFSTGSKFSSF